MNIKRITVNKYFEDMGKVVAYSPNLNIQNINSLPSGLRCNFLLCIVGVNNEMIAKQWKRNAPKVKEGEFVVTFTNSAFNQANKIN